MEDRRPHYLERIRDLVRGEAQRQREAFTLEVPGWGRVAIPFEFWPILPARARVFRASGDAPPSLIGERIRGGEVVVLRGDCIRAAGVLKYVDRMGRAAIDRTPFRGIENRYERSRREQAAVREALHRMAVIVHSGRMPEVTRAPPGLRSGLDHWIEGASDYPTGTPLLVPLRKILRIASDIKRLEEGIHVPALGASIAVMPTVFAPVDGKVTELFAGHAEIEPGSRVLDVGTGTGVLALIAARRGAAVTAVDRNPQAVRNARLNARRLGFEAGMSFPDPADLFGSLGEARFEAILFNAPWLSGTPRTAYEAALYDDGSVISRFLEGAPAHLAPGGAIWLLYADVFERTGHGALSILRELLAKNGLQVRNRWGTKRTGRVSGRAETVVLYEIRRSQTEV